MDIPDLNMPDLESQESPKQSWYLEGLGIKILATDQMLSRLPINIAQLKSRKQFRKT